MTLAKYFILVVKADKTVNLLARICFTITVPAELESNYEMLPHRIPSAAAVAQDKRHLRQTHTSPQKLSHHPRSKQSDVARESSHPQQSRTSPEASQDQPDRSQAKLQDKQDSLKTLHAVSALGESRVAYQQTGVSGQRGKTATVLAHIEPVVCRGAAFP